MQVYTIQMAQWRKLKALGIELIDTTVKSGIPAFAPSWDIVMAVKSGQLPESEYTRIYLNMLEGSQLINTEDWDQLLKYEAVAFACYCAKGLFCHRHLLAPIFQAYALSRGVTVVLSGEVV